MAQSNPDHDHHAPRTLMVVIHGLSVMPHRLGDVARAAREAYGPDTEVRIPELPHSRLLSGLRATQIVSSVLALIDGWVDELKPERIVLIGHSIGATLARRCFLVAAGCPANFAPEPKLAREAPRAWAARVERVVLLAAFNRGWKISARLSWYYSALFNLVGFLGHVIPGGAWTPTAFDFRLGAPFMAQTRLNWLAYRRSRHGAAGDDVIVAKPRRQPILLQLLGTQDDLVSPFDQVDIAVDGSGQASAPSEGVRTASDPKEQDYFLIELPFTDHGQAITLYGDAVATERRQIVVKALTGDRTKLGAIALDPSLLADTIETVDPKVCNTVFVIHGIRDDGFWTHRIAERVREAGNVTDGTQPTVFRSWTPSYGYFAMLPFMLPWIRREKVEWFMDQYVTAFAQYPNSDFHYVGHSNGTYLAARALHDYPALHFKQVFFAGSVVRRDYPWASIIDSGRVTRFQNVTASGDWVVACFPKSVEWIPGSDVGGAGFDGFHDAGSRPEITEFRYVRGGHGAGVSEAHWASIARFIVHGKPFEADPKADPMLYDPTPDPTVEILGKLRIGIPAVLVIALFVLWLGLHWSGLFGLLVSFLVIYFIVTRM